MREKERKREKPKKRERKTETRFDALQHQQETGLQYKLYLERPAPVLLRFKRKNGTFCPFRFVVFFFFFFLFLLFFFLLFFLLFSLLELLP